MTIHGTTGRKRYNWNTIKVASVTYLALLAGVHSLRAQEWVVPIFEGVTYHERRTTVPRPLQMHILVIDLAAPGLRFKLTPPGGSRETRLQSPLEFLVQEKAQLAINAHFYVPFPPSGNDVNVVGFAVSEGVVVSPFEPQPVAPGFQDQSYAIVPCAAAINIDAQNRARIVRLDPGFPDNKHIQEAVSLWTAFAGSAQVITHGRKTIPEYSDVPGGLVAMNGYSSRNSWYDYKRARSVAGLNYTNGTLVLFTVDEVNGSLGMTVGEVADLLIQDFQVYNAINLDGDGSTALAWQDPVSLQAAYLNHPSDNALGRKVGSNLAIWARPVPTSPPPLSMMWDSTGRLCLSWPATHRDWVLEECPDLQAQGWKPAPQEMREAALGSTTTFYPQRKWDYFRLQPPTVQGVWVEAIPKF